MFSIFIEFPWLGITAAFIAGAIIGSFLNVCIYRIPLEKSITWPGSRCGNCLQPIHWADNIPLISYWRLKGKCRMCGVGFSSRYFWLEFLTALSFALLFWLEAILNFRETYTPPTNPDALVVIWLYHALFLCFLIVATMIDADWMEIPRRVTWPGTALGILGGILMPWPWPAVLNPLVAANLQQLTFGGFDDLTLPVLGSAQQPWPVWMPPPDWLVPGSWQMGLATSLAGALAGTMIIRAIRFVFTWGLGKEAMGLGDADLMMMIGAFLGWQSVIMTFIFSIPAALLYVLIILLRNRRGELPFGPFLSAGAVLAVLFPQWPRSFFGVDHFSQRFFFSIPTLVLVFGLFAVLIGSVMLAWRMVRLIVEAASQGSRAT